MEEPDIRFSAKKVDESWKEQAAKERESADSKFRPQSPGSSSQSSPKQSPKTSKPFMNLLSSLGYQAMYHLGELPEAQGETNLEAAKEMIDLLISVKEKTAGNLSSEETQVFDSILPELQLKFSQKA